MGNIIIDKAVDFIKKAKSKLDQCNKNETALVNKIKELKILVKQLEDQLSTCSSENISLQATINNLNLKISQLQSEIDTLNTNLNTLDTTILDYNIDSYSPLSDNDINSLINDIPTITWNIGSDINFVPDSQDYALNHNDDDNLYVVTLSPTTAFKFSFYDINNSLMSEIISPADGTWQLVGDATFISSMAKIIVQSEAGIPILIIKVIH